MLDEIGFLTCSFEAHATRSEAPELARFVVLPAGESRALRFGRFMTRCAGHSLSLARPRACFDVLLLTLLASCAAEGASGGLKVGDPVDINGDGVDDGLATDSNGDGVADSVDLDGDGTPDARLPWLNGPDPAGDGDGDGDDAGGGDGDGDGPGDGDGDGDAPSKPDGGAPLDIPIPLAKVPCGASECEIREDNLCCESWTLNGGFGTAKSMCITEDACVSIPTLTDPFEAGLYSYIGAFTTRAVVSLCDGAEDCKSEQVCCYVRQGTPIPESIADPPVWIGPGAGRQCMLPADCTNFASANGVPTGFASCNDQADCALIPGTSCQPELDASATTGKAGKGRAGFKVCR
jgi:hypothetical protein